MVRAEPDLMTVSKLTVPASAGDEDALLPQAEFQIVRDEAFFSSSRFSYSTYFTGSVEDAF